jgi:DUF917 family protein
MRVRELDAQSIRDIAIGSAVLGAGGGGDPVIGMMAALYISELSGPPVLIRADELGANDAVVSPFGIGSPLVSLEKFSFGPELERAYHEFVAMVGRPVAALVAAEIGGMNSMTPLALGARLGVPILDADLIGRAAPHMGLTTAALNGLPVSPIVLADEHGNLVTVKAVDDLWADGIARSVVMDFGATAAACGFMLTGEQVRTVPIQGSISYAESIGRTIREARDRRDPIAAAILRATKGSALFTGKVVDVQRHVEHSLSVGRFTLSGLDADTGSECTVDFQNENLIAWRDGEVVATTPDLITLLDIDSGATVQTELVRYGLRTIVLGIPADPVWHTAAGVALFGPGRFGYDVPFKAVPAAGCPYPEAV